MVSIFVFSFFKKLTTSFPEWLYHFTFPPAIKGRFSFSTLPFSDFSCFHKCISISHHGLVKAMVFPVVMYGCESWTVKKAERWRLMLLNCGVGEHSWESLDCKEIQPVHSKGDQPWDFFGRNGAKAETPVLRPPHTKSWLIGKDSDAGRDWGQEEKGTTEDEMAGWHHRLDGRESEWTPGVGDGQGGLACCDSWVREESDTTERLSWTGLWS